MSDIIIKLLEESDAQELFTFELKIGIFLRE